MAQIHNTAAARLLQTWEEVRRGGPELLVLEGQAGLGKSFLVSELRQRVQRGADSTVILSAGNVVAGVLRGFPELITRRDAAFVEAARPYLPAHSWPALVAGRATQEPPEVVIARAVSECTTQTTPLLLLIEDLHDHSTQSQAFLRALWTRCLLDERPMLLVLTSRPLAEYPAAHSLTEELQRSSQLIRGRSGLHETLHPVDETGVQVVLETHLGSGAPEQLTRWLYDHAGGHPLRCAELLHLLRDQGALRMQGHGWQFRPPPSASLPPSLSAVILTRLRGVQAASGPWRLLSALAVLDGSAEERPWQQVARVGPEVFGAAQSWLLHRDLIRLVPGAGAARFQCGHPLYVPLLRAELDWNELTTLHARAAEADLDILERARHARSAELPSAWQRTREALHAARQRGAHPDVIREARELLDWKNGGGPLERTEAAEVRLALVQSLRLTGALEEVLTETQPAPEVDTDNQPSSALLAARAQALMELGRLPEATELARIALTAAQPGTLAHLLLEEVLYRALVNSGQLDAAQQGLEAALNQNTPPGGARRMQLLELLAHLAHRRGDYHLSLHLGRGAVAEGEAERLDESMEPQHAELCWRARNYAGSSAIHMSLWDEAERHLHAAHALVTRHAMTARLMVVEGNFAYVHLMRGEYTEAEAGSWVQYRRAEASGNIRVQAALLWNIGICRLWRGDAVQALDCMQRSLAQWPSVGSANPTDFAEALAFQGRLDEAREMLTQPNHDHYPEHPNSAARVHLLLRQPRAALDAAEAISERDGHGLYARRCLVQAQAHLQLAQQAGADALLDEAAQHAALASHRSVGAEVQLTRAVWEWRAGQQQTARQRWKQATGELLLRGDGHTQFVQTLFPQEAAALQEGVPSDLSATPPARLRLFGSLQIERPGREGGAERPWRGRKVKELLALLICAYYSEGVGAVPREHLMLELWPDADSDSAELSFRKTVARVRETLGGAALLTRDAHGRYRLEQVHSDLDDFLKALERQLDAVAVSLYRAPFLNDLDLSAVLPLRDALHTDWRRTLLRFAANESQAAQPHLLRLLAHDPLDLEATLALLESFRRANDLEAHDACLKRARAVYHTATGEIPAELLAGTGMDREQRPPAKP
ncbi:AAA family ATPase (plasmid) [Deinococcus sp. KNUC1210]|uniref:AAA family ATPase n=1 Tax=Deinococcus sp. KNUC1210 TaxID=2917691 RepID=UPI001EF0AAD1|nr:AAA family ATPase [Deinococcus sp. KNUC1210]ULH14277.1 AAA family ATPase [Deinococcus sp. KNUC1210]